MHHVEGGERDVRVGTKEQEDEDDDAMRGKTITRLKINRRFILK